MPTEHETFELRGLSASGQMIDLDRMAITEPSLEAAIVEAHRLIPMLVATRPGLVGLNLRKKDGTTGHDVYPFGSKPST